MGDEQTVAFRATIRQKLSVTVMKTPESGVRLADSNDI